MQGMMNANYFEIQKSKCSLQISGKLLSLEKPLIMGILNATPDSFFKESRVAGVEEGLIRAEAMLDAGADILDIGAYSSRPGAEHISEQEELDRLLPLVEKISSELPQAVLSIDTFRSRVAEEALKRGAHIVNDISGGTDDEFMFEIAAKYDAPLILMHKKGNPQNMQLNPSYEDVVLEVYDYFIKQVSLAKSKGISQLVLDVGFGFGKSTEHNYQLLRNMKVFQSFGYPILLGISRKGMIWKNLNILPEEALNGTTVLNTIGLQNSADILRVHDVKEAKEIASLWDLYCR